MKADRAATPRRAEDMGLVLGHEEMVAVRSQVPADRPSRSSMPTNGQSTRAYSRVAAKVLRAEPGL